MVRVLSAMFVASALSLPASKDTVEIAPGVHMPLTVLGTSHGIRGENLTKIVTNALSLGFKAVDTAHGYGPGDLSYDQKAVGNAVRKFDRDSYFLITKVPGGCDKEHTAVTLEENLEALGLDYVDLVIIHQPVSNAKQTYMNCSSEEAMTWSLEKSVQVQWEAMEDFYRAGKARAIGVSSFCAKVMDALLQTATVPPAINQCLYHAGMGDDPDGLISYSKSHNITVQAFSPLDQGRPDIISGEPFKSIGAKYNKSGVQANLRWLVQHDPPVSYVVALSSAKHALEDLDVYNWTLAAEDYATLSAVKACKAFGMSYPCLPYNPGAEGCNECCCEAPLPRVLCCCNSTIVL